MLEKDFLKNNKKKILIAGMVIGGFLLTALSLLVYEIYFLNHKTESGCASTVFTIEAGEGTRDIVKRLESSCIIPGQLPFLVYLKVSGLASSIQAGEYDLSQALTPRQVADILTKGKVASRKITIPEGWTIDDIGSYLEKEGITTKASFEAAVKKDYSYDFLTSKPLNVDLEGFLFPDTYQISQTATADDIVRLMLDNFDKRLDPSTRASIEGSGMSLYEVVNLASVVEREVAKPEDRKVVAGIFLNRLENNMPLESCATIQYILKSNKQRFSYEETRVESPFNTYINPGLPLGPIGNPGIDSIKAVLFPTISDYLYFVSADGVTYYSKTLDEHEEKIAKYLNN